MDKITAEELVDHILSNLQDRGGFDSWWWSVDPDTQDTIYNELTDIARKY